MFTVSGDSQDQTTRYNIRKADWELFSCTLSDLVEKEPAFTDLGYFPEPSPALSKSLLQRENQELEQKLDFLGERLTSAINRAATTAIPRIKPGLKPKPWWNEQLRDLRRDLQRKQR